MAIKEKKEEQRSRLLEYIATEHKWENYFFLFVALFVLVLGIFILNGTLEIKSTVPVIGSYPKAFAIVIVILSTASLVYSIYPFFQASFPELKKVTWPTWKVFLVNSFKVLFFLVLFTLLYLLYDVLISELLGMVID